MRRRAISAFCWIVAIASATGSLSAIPAELPSAESCKDCHYRQYAEWSTSRHRVSFTNAIFQRGLKRDPSPSCLKCHLPLEAQRAELRRGGNSALVGEGVTCVTCHGAAHSGVHAKLRESSFCAKCHQFSFLGARELAQTTYDEWKLYRNIRSQRCQDCHMPNGSHRFPGAHDVPFLKKGLEVRFERRGGMIAVELKNAGAGHAIPTGDIFRELRIETKRLGKSLYEPQAILGRQPYFAKRDGKVALRWKRDNALKPFETRRFEFSSQDVTAVRVVYYYEGPLPGFDTLSGDALAHTVLFEKTDLPLDQWLPLEIRSDKRHSKSMQEPSSEGCRRGT